MVFKSKTSFKIIHTKSKTKIYKDKTKCLKSDEFGFIPPNAM